MSEDTAPVAESFESLFGTSEEDSEMGKWFKVGKTAELKVRRHSSKKSVKVREALMADYAGRLKSIPGYKIPDDELESINTEHLATGILADWKGIKENGVDVPYSKAAAIKALTKFPDLRTIVASLAIEIDNYRTAVNKVTEGN